MLFMSGCIQYAYRSCLISSDSSLDLATNSSLDFSDSLEENEGKYVGNMIPVLKTELSADFTTGSSSGHWPKRDSSSSLGKIVRLLYGIGRGKGSWAGCEYLGLHIGEKYCWAKWKITENFHILGGWKSTVTSDFVRSITSAAENLSFPLWKDVFSSEDDNNSSSNWTSETLLAWHSATLGLPFILWFAVAQHELLSETTGIWKMCCFHHGWFIQFLMLLSWCCI